jgi:hypothetical protein
MATPSNYQQRILGEVTNSTEFNDACLSFLQLYKENLTQAGAKASGTLIDSVITKWRVEFKNSLVNVIIRLPEYWYYVEEGRKPTQGGGNGQLLTAILEWMQQKKRAGLWGISRSETPKRNAAVALAKARERRGAQVGGRRSLVEVYGSRYTKEDIGVAYVITQLIHYYGYYAADHHGKHILRDTKHEATSNGTMQKILNGIKDHYGNAIIVELAPIKNIKITGQ